MEGNFSSPYKFLIDTTPPLLKILRPYPNEETKEELITVEGKTEATARVLIDGKAIVHNNGNFLTKVYLKTGKNPIEIIARDPHGNEKVTLRKVYKLTRTGKKITKKAKEIKKKFKKKKYPYNLPFTFSKHHHICRCSIISSLIL